MKLITIKNFHKQILIDGIKIHKTRVNVDSDGILVESLRKDWNDVYGIGRTFSMQYFSVTKRNIAKDESVWHFHNKQEDRVIIAQGEIIMAVADNRVKSKTFGMLNLFLMTSTSPYMLLVPKKTLHGFLTISKDDVVMLNFPTDLYNPKNDNNTPFDKVGIRFESGELFSWNIIRKELKLPQKNHEI